MKPLTVSCVSNSQRSLCFDLSNNYLDYYSSMATYMSLISGNYIVTYSFSQPYSVGVSIFISAVGK